jgi:hypothetical protein
MRKLHHQVLVTISFNKPISRRAAVREARDNIHGTFYCSHGICTGYSEAYGRGDERTYPDKFRVRSVKTGGRQ